MLLFLFKVPVEFKVGCPTARLSEVYFEVFFISPLQFRSAIYMHFVAVGVQKHLYRAFIRRECYC